MGTSFLNRIKQGVSGAKETVSNYQAARQGDKKSKERIYLMAVNTAKKQYRIDNPGKEMTPQKLKDEYQGGYVSSPTRKYTKDRDTENNRLRKKFGF
jgi:hypothetical protein